VGSDDRGVYRTRRAVGGDQLGREDSREDSRASPGKPGKLWLGMAPSPSPHGRQAVRETAAPVNVSPDEVLLKFLRGDILQLAPGDAAGIAFLPQAPGARQPAPSGQEPQD
jgi:hypothetical protein